MNGSLVGMILAIALSGMALVQFDRLEHHNRMHARFAITSGQFAMLIAGATRYVQAHKADLEVSVPVGTTFELPLQNLVDESDLTKGFSGRNPFGQRWSVYVQQPTSGQVVAFVTSNGGHVLQVGAMSEIANHASDKAGFIPQNGVLPGVDSSSAVGAGMGWFLALSGRPNPGPGHLYGQVGIDDSELHDDVLYRVAVQNHPELNQMQTTLNMGGNNIASAKAIGAGHADPSTGWPSGWGKSGLIAWDVYSEASIAAGTNGSIKSWINAQGDGHVDNNFSANRIGTMNYAPDGGYPTNWGGGVHTWDVYAEGTIAAGRNGNIASSMNTSGQGYFDRWVQIGRAAGAYPGNPCAAWGTIAMQSDGSGRQLNCQLGYWHSMSEPVSFYVPPTTKGFRGYARVNHFTGGYSCPGGTTDYTYVTLWYGDYGYSEGHICE